MKRYSFMWWLVIVPTSVTVGGSSILLTSFLTDWSILTRLAVAVFATAIADLAIAASMQAVAPTRVHIGPGERHLVSDAPAETAIVLSGFDAVPDGLVSIRGETWRAVRAAGDSGTLTAGVPVRVVDRKGLTLVVSSRPG